MMLVGNWDSINLITTFETGCLLNIVMMLGTWAYIRNDTYFMFLTLSLLLAFPLLVSPDVLLLALLSSTFMNDLTQVLHPDSTVLSSHITTIFLTGKDPIHLTSSLQSCLNLANSWKVNNDLKLNATKTECVLICSHKCRDSPPPLELYLSGSRIK